MVALCSSWKTYITPLASISSHKKCYKLKWETLNNKSFLKFLVNIIKCKNLFKGQFPHNFSLGESFGLQYSVHCTQIKLSMFLSAAPCIMQCSGWQYIVVYRARIFWTAVLWNILYNEIYCTMLYISLVSWTAHWFIVPYSTWLNCTVLH